MGRERGVNSVGLSVIRWNRVKEGGEREGSELSRYECDQVVYVE